MRSQKLGMMGAAIFLLTPAGCGEANSSDFTLFGIREDRTLASVRVGGPPMPRYAEALHAEIFREIRRNYMPFRLIAPARLVVAFAVNRRGELVQLSIVQKSRAKPIDDYAMLMVRQASRRFPAAPADQPSDVVAFHLPIIFQ